LLLRGLQFSVAGSLLGALAAGVILGGVTLVLVRSLMDMPTDATPRSADLVGSMGTVVTRIPEGGLGEISLVASGQRMKLNARAKGPIDSGRPIIVVDVTSPTSVVVTESEFQDY
jgi:membrane-bound ClpP family serine protease